MVQECLDRARVDAVVAGLIDLKVDPDPVLETTPSLWSAVLRRVDGLMDRALDQRAPAAAFELHSALRALLRLRSTAHRNRRELSAHLSALAARICSRWIDHECAALPTADIPADLAGMTAWFDRTIATHPAPDHPLYRYLETEGTREAFRYFVAQEIAVSADFADLLALTQVGLPIAWKGEVARNYWDEMGEGQLDKRHGKMFRDAAADLDIAIPRIEPSLGALVCGNLFLALASYRCFHLTSIGALAVTELAVPGRFRRLVNAGHRLGLSPAVIAYYETHVEADTTHAGGWLREVILPALQQGGAASADIVAGVHLRLVTSQRYCDELLATMRTERPSAR
jgi:hypothetical protein